MGIGKRGFFMVAVILFTFTLSVYFYPRMPEEVASHWNSRGEVDGYMPKFWGVFLMPVVLVGLVLLFTVIPYIDPLKENIMKFRRYYDGLIILLLVFMLSIHTQMILWNIGVKVSPNLTLPVGVGLLFIYVGVLCEHAERNWFIGIRTPWTLSSERVWKKTHKVGGKLFKIAGLIALLGVFFQSHAVYFIIIPAITVAAYTVVYSYIEYQKGVK